jgi:hypothetical protein
VAARITKFEAAAHVREAGPGFLLRRQESRSARIVDLDQQRVAAGAHADIDDERDPLRLQPGSALQL